MDTIQLKLPSKPEFVTTLRLTTASIAQIMGFDVEAVDDLRVCVSEAVNYLLEENESLDILFQSRDDRLVISIKARPPREDDPLHYRILECLMDEVVWDDDRVELVKYR